MSVLRCLLLRDESQHDFDALIAEHSLLEKVVRRLESVAVNFNELGHFSYKMQLLVIHKFSWKTIHLSWDGKLAIRLVWLQLIAMVKLKDLVPPVLGKLIS